ncbi:MAG: hypothetical protein JWO45_1376 [Spartobacteria bacterium]|nr:hypothetical protein [Spartobacteria bacterium]
MNKTILMAAVAVVALTGAANAGGAHQLKAGVSGHFSQHRLFHTPKGAKTLYDQTGNDSGSANTSQNFESSFDQYDNQGADDFTVPKGHTWTVSEVDVTGQYRYSGGSADTANVFFYKDKKGAPNKKALAECDDVSTNDSGATGSFALSLGKCAPSLAAGTYWVSVQANLDFSNPAEQWYWGTTTGALGAPAVWQDPNGGWTALGIPADCTKYKPLSYCLAGVGDWLFAVKGKDKK